MRVLVTGASGFLGSHVAEQLAREGHVVRALVRKTSNRKFLESLPKIELAEGSVEQADRVDEAMKGVDAVIHSAGLVKARSREEFFATNVTGTENMLSAAKKHAPKLRRFVFVSSLAAVGPARAGKPVSPTQEPTPVTHYGRSKLAAERAVIAAKGELPVTVIRPPFIYGPRDLESLQIFQFANRGVRLTYGDGSTAMSVVYAADAASACVRAIDADVPSGSAFFVDDGKVYTLKEMMIAIEESLGKKAFFRFGIPLPVVKGYATLSEAYGKVTNKAMMVTRDKYRELTESWVCASDDTRKALGWAPQVSWPEGTRLAAEWYRDQGML
jgi:nucleoside-diphosphate-sugar epimerase